MLEVVLQTLEEFTDDMAFAWKEWSNCNHFDVQTFGRHDPPKQLLFDISVSMDAAQAFKGRRQFPQLHRLGINSDKSMKREIL